MAQVIKIKRSNSTAEPSSLNQGELAYSSNSKKLFIGNPGDAAVTEIGGLHFVEMLKGTRVLPNNLIIGDGNDGGGYVELREDTDNGANYVRLKAPDSIGSNLIFTLPTADGTDGQFIKTDGSGNLSFVSQVSAEDATISIAGGTGLKTGGNFTTNQSSDETITLNLDVNSLTGITTAAQSDAFIIADSSDSNAEKKITFTNLEDSIFGNISGDATVAAGGALTIAGNAVEASMLNTNVISGQTNMTGDVADSDEMLISDAGVLKKLDFSVLRDAVFNDVSGDATVAAGGALTIGAGTVENSMLAGSIANSKLVNDSVTVGSTEINLGGSTTTVAGLTKVTSTDFVGDLSKADSSGTDSPGADLTLKGGAGTGAGVGGSVLIQVADGGSTGSSVNSHATALTIADDKTMTAAGNVVISGNLTVSGTTTTVNSETINLADNILLINSNYSGNSATENGGLEVNRDTTTGGNAKLLWNETSDKWQAGLGSSMYNLLTTNNFETEITSIDGGSF